ncbi:elongation factor P--(R)-beta-lysine ligase [Thalassotalea mangrovi]|uniref:Elongation factor P--(R)-beta-lysine ligase n=1 Tax=Thalassotalea mangrovi TaxID=2572245 RepID=A0A4U1B3P1_9GAMM|nr:elongation factor P--(R)-beta-lysine ligase [Thalassotalea mangrovi]TKB43986.1 elongation factor P--(R)-beta-lysine ligase [Thalassotalea mangrovi]
MWQPSASIETLKARAEFISRIRQFFAERGVMEVETPLLSQATVTDIHLQSFKTELAANVSSNNQNNTLYLQTSPEFAMKRLLAAGSGAIYQLGKAFRNEEQGRHHNPEFTMLEWYRPGFDHHQLMTEIDALMQILLACEPAQKITYQQIFIDTVNLDPLTATTGQLRELILDRGMMSDWLQQEQDKDTLLQFVFASLIEPVIGQHAPCFVYHFPASQAALARLEPEDNRVARRFELYYRNMELANGFDELTSAGEQQHRFELDNNLRRDRGLTEQPIDSRLIAALQHGMPDCSGVAMGVDRLLMLKLDKPKISDVLSFDLSRC